MSLKLATWNVMLPVASRRREALRAHIDTIAPDVIVLTETHDGFEPGLCHAHSSAAGRDGSHGAEHRWVSIWSRFPLESIDTSDPQRTAAARVMPDHGDPFLIYGTVLPWTGSPWREHPSAGGIAFRESLAVQRADWLALREAHSHSELFVMGDFNQDLVTPRYCGSRANRSSLEAALADAGLVALTGGERDPIRRDSPACACIDHIAARTDSRWRASATKRWPETERPEKWLTDHFGVAVVLDA
jgi:endonuclease/exonuclease/phosphatase family metal-dependent hydrolase